MAGPRICPGCDLFTPLQYRHVCVNQKTLLERGQQVQLIREVFSQATETHVWLGVEVEESSKTFISFELFSDIFPYSLNPTDPIEFDYRLWGPPSSWRIANELVALEYLLVRPWWYRVWVVQEVAVSWAVWVYYDRRKCSWQTVVNTAFFVQWHEITLEDVATHHLQSTRNTLRGDMFLLLSLRRIVNISAVRFAFGQNRPARMRKYQERPLSSSTRQSFRRGNGFQR